MTLHPGEYDAVKQVLEYGGKYGYGNLIAHLRREWALTLMAKYGFDYEDAVFATNVMAYPKERGLEQMANAEVTVNVLGLEEFDALAKRADRLEKLLKEASDCIWHHHEASYQPRLGHACTVCVPGGTDIEDSLLMRISRELKPAPEKTVLQPL